MLAISGSNQRLQDFNSVLQSKLVRYCPVFEHKREYQSAFFLFLFTSVKQLSKQDWFLKHVFHHDSFRNCWCWFFHLCHEKFHCKRYMRKCMIPHCSMLFLDPSLQGCLAYSCLSATAVHARHSKAEVQ